MSLLRNKQNDYIYYNYYIRNNKIGSLLLQIILLVIHTINRLFYLLLRKINI